MVAACYADTNCKCLSVKVSGCQISSGCMLESTICLERSCHEQHWGFVLRNLPSTHDCHEVRQNNNNNPCTVYVHKVKQGSLAQAAGVKCRDCILQVDGHPVDNVENASAWVKRSGNQMVLRVRRHVKPLPLPPEIATETPPPPLPPSPIRQGSLSSSNLNPPPIPPRHHTSRRGTTKETLTPTPQTNRGSPPPNFKELPAWFTQHMGVLDVPLGGVDDFLVDMPCDECPPTPSTSTPSGRPRMFQPSLSRRHFTSYSRSQHALLMGTRCKVAHTAKRHQILVMESPQDSGLIRHRHHHSNEELANTHNREEAQHQLGDNDRCQARYSIHIPVPSEEAENDRLGDLISPVQSREAVQKKTTVVPQTDPSSSSSPSSLSKCSPSPPTSSPVSNSQHPKTVSSSSEKNRSHSNDLAMLPLSPSLSSSASSHNSATRPRPVPPFLSDEAPIPPPRPNRPTGMATSLPSLRHQHTRQNSVPEVEMSHHLHDNTHPPRRRTNPEPDSDSLKTNVLTHAISTTSLGSLSSISSTQGLVDWSRVLEEAVSSVQSMIVHHIDFYHRLEKWHRTEETDEKMASQWKDMQNLLQARCYSLHFSLLAECFSDEDTMVMHPLMQLSISDSHDGTEDREDEEQDATWREVLHFLLNSAIPEGEKISRGLRDQMDTLQTVIQQLRNRLQSSCSHMLADKFNRLVKSLASVLHLLCVHGRQVAESTDHRLQETNLFTSTSDRESRHSQIEDFLSSSRCLSNFRQAQAMAARVLQDERRLRDALISASVTAGLNNSTENPFETDIDSVCLDPVGDVSRQLTLWASLALRLELCIIALKQDQQLANKIGARM